MRKSAALFALVAMLLAACTTAESASRPSGNRMDIRRSSPPTGMDGRPATGTEAASSQPPAGWAGSGRERPGPSGPPAAIVPDVREMFFADAVHRLWRVGISFDLVHARTSDRPRWSVIEQTPPPGSDTPDSGEINLVLSMPHAVGEGAYRTVRCRPSPGQLSSPYCVGKLLQY